MQDRDHTNQAPPGTPPESCPDYRSILHGLILMGNDIAVAIHAEVTAPEGDKADPEPRMTLEAAAAAFDRVSRAVRRAITLARHIDQVPEPAEARQQQRTAIRARIIRAVQDDIAYRAPPEASAALQAELRERLDQPELENEILGRPTEQIIADILRDIGLGTGPGFPNRWPRRTPADITVLATLAGTPLRTTGPVAPPCRQGTGSRPPASMQPGPLPRIRSG